jgi:(E)-4-hydroxy-3-methylbut-2-enyl-diphosphate synthase
MRVADKGCDIVRITVQGRKEADKCYEIKNTLVQKGYVHTTDLLSPMRFTFIGNFCFDSITSQLGKLRNKFVEMLSLSYWC